MTASSRTLSDFFAEATSSINHAHGEACRAAPRTLHGRSERRRPFKALSRVDTAVIEPKVSVDGVVPGSVAVLCEARKRDDGRWSV